MWHTFTFSTFCVHLDVKNLQQLARVLKLPLQLVVKYYNLFKDMVREHGGPEGMARLVDLWEVTIHLMSEPENSSFGFGCIVLK